MAHMTTYKEQRVLLQKRFPRLCTVHRQKRGTAIFTAAPDHASLVSTIHGIIYHDTIVAYIEYVSYTRGGCHHTVEHIHLDSGGYRTETTKVRINSVLPNHMRLLQRQKEWYISVRDSSHVEGFLILFTDGMVITDHGEVVSR